MLTDRLTNTVYFSSLLPGKCPILNAHLIDALLKHNIPYAYLSGTKDIWCRDFMPIQVNAERFVFFKYTPDYLQDKVGLKIQTNPEDVFQNESNNLKKVLPQSSTIDIVLDGGNVVKCDDVVVMTDKVFVENKDKTPAEVERILKDAFQSEILFLPWDGDMCGHSDGIVHYAGNNRILITNYKDFSRYYYYRYLKLLEKKFEVIPLKYKAQRLHARSWAYINFLQIGNIVLVPQLGLEEDRQALEQIKEALPDCEIISIPALEAVRRGGALNCISWNISTLEGYKNRALSYLKTPYYKRIEEESAEYW
ncbi:MAG: agmatine deiminase family protein [Bacteroidales bacterium]|nr:agmatine deiminase family protein [Bacteroidales bacterium]